MKSNEVKLRKLFKERFCELRGEKSNTEFGEFLEMSRQTVGFYANGDRLPDVASLARIANKCGVSTDYLLGLTDIESPNMDERAISDYTGLSTDAIKKLKRVSDFSLLPLKQTTCAFINSHSFELLMRKISMLSDICDITTTDINRIKIAINSVHEEQNIIDNPLTVETTNSIHLGELLNAENQINSYAFEITETILSIAEEINSYRSIKNEIASVFDDLTLLISAADTGKYTLFDAEGNTILGDDLNS